MSNDLRVRWKSGMSREDFQASFEAAHNFPNLDAITVSVGIKGELSEGDLAEILRIADRSEAKVAVTLTATFEEGKQLRLFGPADVVGGEMYDRVQTEIDDILEASE